MRVRQGLSQGVGLRLPQGGAPEANEQAPVNGIVFGRDRVEEQLADQHTRLDRYGYFADVAEFKREAPLEAGMNAGRGSDDEAAPPPAGFPDDVGSQVLRQPHPFEGDRQDEIAGVKVVFIAEGHEM